MSIFSNAYLSSISRYASFIQERILPSLTPQQKKIVIIASIAFACLTVCYAVGYFFSKRKANESVPPLNAVNEVDGKTETKKDDEKTESKKSDGKAEEKVLQQTRLITGGPFGDAEYQGEIRNGKPHGHGKKTYPGHDSGMHFEENGEFEDGVFKSGKFTIAYDNAADAEKKVMEGTFTQGKKGLPVLNGQGKVIYPNGAIEEGLFKEGIPFHYKTIFKTTGDSGDEETWEIVVDETHEKQQSCPGKMSKEGVVHEGLFHMFPVTGYKLVEGKITLNGSEVEVIMEGTFVWTNHEGLFSYDRLIQGTYIYQGKVNKRGIELIGRFLKPYHFEPFTLSSGKTYRLPVYQLEG